MTEHRTTREIYLQIFLILCLSGLIALFNYAINPLESKHAAIFPRITAATIYGDPDNYILVDARYSPEEHPVKLKNCIQISPKTFDSDLEKFLDFYSAEKITVIFCDSMKCNTAEQIARKLRDECAIKNIAIYSGDIGELTR